MSVKIERINKEIEKTKGKVNEFQIKLRDLEKQKTELENMEIIGAIRGMDISIEELAALLNKEQTASGQPVPKSKPKNKTNKEGEDEASS